MMALSWRHMDYEIKLIASGLWELLKMTNQKPVSNEKDVVKVSLTMTHVIGNLSASFR